ncbi:heavy metal translocating P-type ATPase [Mucilaginibacter auburnensis]|uniref:Cu+-exporting ATPase n=1 Tax=Mucilaginibacter auburnensis TaxID=1457233 RepID=A0A2H9VRU5_9SPHI|nr:heavy metal translocating P-type ATPase metal-binding domain-containing protein [Mucilaginibacter auburnensis]PJJ83535.1 Cu+-exporting ATPase [Mucilaginibacter auburnensis]
MSVITPETVTACYHCGNDCEEERYTIDYKQFCCHGCKEVYTILSKSGLNNYYCYNDRPGANRAKKDLQLDYLLEPSIIKDLVEYSDDDVTIVTFYIPHIHCSSCIWLLEQLNRLNPAIYYNRVDFLRKQVNIRFSNKDIDLKGVVELLDTIGYEPLISLQDVIKKQAFSRKDDLVRKIAVAGFCFGNVMLLSFPEYLGFSEHDTSFKYFFGWLNLVFTLPVTFYSGWGYMQAAYTTLKNKVLTIDFPLALGIAVLFIRSWIEIATNTGAGFVDTLCGLIFFLLIGKFVQRKTYYHLSFERDYRSFFPVAVQVIEENSERHVPLADLQVGQRIRVRHQEIIPADAILLKGDAKVDFSFVTGESVPVNKTLGEVIYAGGRQMGGAIELEVVKPVSQSYLTRLWNNEAFSRSQDDRIETFSQKVSKYFTVVLLIVAVGSFAYWAPTDMHRAIASLTAVLIIACPCALALSTPFTMSAALGIFDRNLFYLKNAAVVEQIAAIDTLVFDKTGTISIAGGSNVELVGELSVEEKDAVSAVCANSSHPLSQLICQHLGSASRDTHVTVYNEISGRGIAAKANGISIKLGSAKFVLAADSNAVADNGSLVHVIINSKYRGYFTIRHQYREGMFEMRKLREQYQLYLLSGDHNHERGNLSSVFGDENAMHFEQSPQDKLNFIEGLQQKGQKVMMLGDGLNDAGALKQADAGVAVTDNVNNFSPGSDAILDGRSLNKLPAFLKFSKDALHVIYGSFCISFLYNLIGLSFAVTGRLSPVIAAILMPVSTVTIISFTSIATHLAAKKRKLL